MILGKNLTGLKVEVELGKDHLRGIRVRTRGEIRGCNHFRMKNRGNRKGTQKKMIEKWGGVWISQIMSVLRTEW